MKDFFYYTKSERKGIALLCLLLLATLVLPKIYAHFYQPKHTLAWESFQLDSTYLIQQEQLKVTSSPKDTLFYFDPNLVSFTELCALGLSKKTAHILINFREKGGKFFKKDDLLKIYGLDSNWYYRVQPYIQLAEQKRPRPTYAKTNKPRTIAKQPTVKINSASKEEWSQLRGIGTVLSARIVKFRDKLGGFYSLDQVAETYGLPDSTYQKIRSSLVLDTNIQQLAINEASPEVLAGHPYISWKTARLMVNYREMHHGIKNQEQLQKIYGIDSIQLNKIMPYLSF